MNNSPQETIKRLKSDIIPFTEELNQVKLSSYQRQSLITLCEGNPRQYPYQQGRRTIEKFYHEFIDHVSKGVKCEVL